MKESRENGERVRDILTKKKSGERGVREIKKTHTNPKREINWDRD